MRVSTPFEHQVPTDLKENLLWREKIFQKVLEDPGYARTIWNACAADPIFYINGFLYTYDPRLEPSQPSQVPFILYPFQRDGILETISSIGREDLFIEKSRDMGASWLAITAIEYLWHFKRMLSFLLVSRNVDYVDKAGDPKSLFWKIDFIHRYLPKWLMPKGFNSEKHRMSLHLKNPDNESVIDGESTTGEVARGDRRTAILLDEFAVVPEGQKVLSSTRDATRTRLFNSTPAGVNNAYYSIRQTEIKKLRFFWTDHPLKSAGLYRIKENEELEILDPDGYPENYDPFGQRWRERLDGLPRSPWLDEQCKRASTWQEIAQEIMIDYLGSDHQFFLPEAIQSAIDKFAREPDYTGMLDYDSLTGEPSEFREDKNGNLQIWGSLDEKKRLTLDNKYAMGCDVSAGTGSSNSTINAYDIKTNTKVLEYANPYIRPEEFAKQAVAVAHWLHNAYLAWESNGVGRQFGSRVMELGYGNIYFRKREETISKKITQIPGWASTKESKLVLIGNYRAAIEKHMLINRSRVALEECLEYIFMSQGGVAHTKENNKEDPTGARDNHGDRVIADALAWRCMTERVVAPKHSSPKIPIGSLRWRQEQRKKEENKSNRQLLKKDGW